MPSESMFSRTFSTAEARSSERKSCDAWGNWGSVRGSSAELFAEAATVCR